MMAQKVSSRDYMDRFLTKLTESVEKQVKHEDRSLMDRILEALAITFTSERIVVMLMDNKKEWKVAYSFNEKRENYDVWQNAAVRESALIKRSLVRSMGLASDTIEEISLPLWQIGVASAVSIPVPYKKSKAGLLVICNRITNNIPFNTLFVSYEAGLTQVLWNKLISPPVVKFIDSTTNVKRNIVCDELISPLVGHYVQMFGVIPLAKIKRIALDSCKQLKEIYTKADTGSFERDHHFALFKGYLRELWQDGKRMWACAHERGNHEIEHFINSFKQIIALLRGCLKDMDVLELDKDKLLVLQRVMRKLARKNLSDNDVREVLDILLDADFDIDRPLRGVKRHL